ncbi:MAG: ATP-binding cassette domain-containing protein [Rhizobiales bacterium]|nr:ATP-binding cassette domain-containing protein [Hyphomicrobiales bacterium]
MNTRTPLLSIENLSVRFRTRRGIDQLLSRGPSHLTAVDDVSLTVRPGEILGLVGESGSGKTTLGKAVLRLVDPSAGRIVFEGRDISHLSQGELRPLRRRIQTVFQDPLSSLNPRHRVRETIATPLRLHHVAPTSELDAAVDRILTRVGLSPVFRDRYPHELSGGQLQRVAIGRALALEPALMIADEAVSKLDVSVRAQILNLFKDIQTRSGMTMIFITHDLHVARYLCTRIGVMYFGKLVEIAPTEQLFTAPRHPYTVALLSTVDTSLAIDQNGSIAQEAFNPTTDDRRGCRFAKRCPLRAEECAVRHPDGETVSPDHDVSCYRWRDVARRVEERTSNKG